jgi:DNA-binding response OmpR family regulator/nitrogen-specific signal transduction histidine kinase
MAMAAVLERTAIERTRSEAMALLQNRFFVNLSHEFRTPLNLLLGPIRDALDGAYGEINPILRDQLGPMHRSADHLHRLINQLLDLAKLEAGGIRLEARAGDLVAFVRALTLSFASRAEREGKTLLLETAPEALEVYFDRDKLEKIVYNLLSNAFKFTAAGGKIRVSVEEDEGSARIVVRDTGEGIPAAELPFIFDRLHQADASPTRRHEGSGIGLALAKELAELHHGTIKVESEEGFGSTFTLTLPLGRAHLKEEELIVVGDGFRDSPLASGVEEVDGMSHDGSSGSTPATRAHTSSSQPIPTILLVEDNADMRAYLKSHLLAYRILEAEDGEGGLALALSVRPDLVISDVMMPKLDGYGLCAALRKDKRTQDIPVVLLTAKAAEENKLEGLASGADDYLYKPFSARELLARTENLIHRNRKLQTQYRQEVVLRPAEITVTSADAAWLEKVRQVVEAQLGECQFGVERLAEEVGLGRRQLQRKIHALTGGTPHHYIQESRLERARQLLEQHAGNVSEVAYRVGFNDPRHFARLFHQRFGKLPSQLG